MIKINKNSWIHRFNKAVSNHPDWWWDEQTNLCPYFWKTVKHFIILSFLFCFVLAAASIAGTLPLQETKNFGNNWEAIPLWKYFAAPFAGAATAAAGAALFFSVAWVLSRVVIMLEWLLCRKKKSKAKKQGWVSAMWRGYKDKYCPRMEVK